MNDRTYKRKARARKARFTDWRADYAHRVYAPAERRAPQGVQPARGEAALAVLAPNAPLSSRRSDH